MKKIAFIAKTNLNNDGRIINQIKILEGLYDKNFSLDFILFPDKPLTIDLGNRVTVHEIQSSFRNSSILRFFTVFQFTLRALRQLNKLKPSIVHAQDMAVVLPVYIYRILNKNSFTLIYDDHEMPNENESMQYRFLQYYERKLMKSADVVIYANQERQELLEKDLNLSNGNYFLNLPYFEDDNQKTTADVLSKYKHLLDVINELAQDGFKFIMHQGSLEYERGREKLASFSKLPTHKIKILIVGISESDFKTFIEEYDLDVNKFYFVGSVPYLILDEFWKVSDAAIIMYLPTYINNRLCAPNRYFIALKNGIPTIVNQDNPVLSNFTEKYKSGKYIEDIVNEEQLYSIFDYAYENNTLELMKQEEIKKFENIYESFN